MRVWNQRERSPFTLTNSIGEEQGVNTRMHHLEDAARLAMGSFIVEEDLPVSRASRAALKIGTIAAGAAVAVILAIAYLQ